MLRLDHQLLFELELARVQGAAAVAVAQVDVAAAVVAALVDVSLKEHVIGEQQRTEEGGALLRRHGRIVDLELEHVGVREHLADRAGQRLGLELGDGRDVADVHGHAAVLVDALDPEGHVAAVLGASTEEGGAREGGPVLVSGQDAVHDLYRGRQAAGEGHGLLHSADYAILGELASLAALDARDGAGVDERFLGAAVNAD